MTPPPSTTPELLQRIEEKIDATHDDVLVIKQIQQDDHARLAKHQEALYGNGKVGLITTVAQLQHEMQIILHAVEIAGATVLVALVGAIIWLIVTHPASIIR